MLLAKRRHLGSKVNFKVDISTDNGKTSAVFFVYEGNCNVSNLISLNTAKELDLIPVNSVTDEGHESDLDSKIKARFANCFSGVGKLKGTKVKLHLDKNYEPIAQPVRRLPFGYRDKVADLLERLQKEDIIEPVEGVASKWVSPIVVVPKADNDIRIYVH